MHTCAYIYQKRQIHKFHADIQCFLREKAITLIIWKTIFTNVVKL